MEPQNRGRLYITLLTVALAIIAFDTLLWQVDAVKWQEQLLERLDAAGAVEVYDADIADFGENDYADAYEKSVQDVGDLASTHTKDGVSLTRTGVHGALSALKTARTDYLTEAHRLIDEAAAKQEAEEAARKKAEEDAAAEEAAKKKAEEEAKAAQEAKEAEERAAAEAQAAKEAQERAAAEAKAAEERAAIEEAQQKAAQAEADRNTQLGYARELAEAGYVEPTCYLLTPSADQLFQISHQLTEDLDGYYGSTGWDAYDKAADTCRDVLESWVYYDGRDFVFEGTSTTEVYYTADDVTTSIANVSQARRTMIVDVAVERAKKYAGLNPTGTTSNPVVYVGDVGGRYHARADCDELLAQANIIYPVNKYDVLTDQILRCSVCYN